MFQFSNFHIFRLRLGELVIALARPSLPTQDTYANFPCPGRHEIAERARDPEQADQGHDFEYELSSKVREVLLRSLPVDFGA